ncbi:tautomerase family protein [Paraburkholderia sabiae]|nr:tautomerase family protein [Paraburkholderia sabiae]WJZ77767.1 tautomerase family protein [Paraburkholderia sabiae]
MAGQRAYRRCGRRLREWDAGAQTRTAQADKPRESTSVVIEEMPTENWGW